LCLDCISLDQLKFVLIAKLVDTLRDFSSHAGIDFDSNSFLASFKEGGCKVSGTWPDFKDYISWFNSRFLNDLLYNQRVLKNMLAESFIKCEVIACSWGLSDLTLFVHYLIEL